MTRQPKAKTVTNVTTDSAATGKLVVADELATADVTEAFTCKLGMAVVATGTGILNWVMI